MKRATLFRGGFYLGGLMLTALGSVLSAKAGLGVSATMAVPFAVTNVTGVKLSVTCFVVSSLMIVAQFLILGRESRKKDLLQFPLNLLFGIFLEWFGSLFALALVVDLVTGGKVISIGLGTVMAMIFIGRTVSLWNRFFRGKLLAAAALE